MTTFTARLISGLGLMTAAFIPPAFSATAVMGGVIHFYGAIVASPCEVSSQPEKLAVSCPENNVMKTRRVSYKDVLNGQTPPDSPASLSMKYLNPEKTLAVVQLDYR